MTVRGLFCAAALVVSCASANAQALPAGPLEFADGRVTIAGDVSAGYGSDDTNRYFNYTDYDHSALRLFRVDLSAAVSAGEHVAFLGELRSENLDSIEPYAAYVRIRPWTSLDFDIQAGRIPPTFGAFARRTYPSDNPLIGYPLAYQYLTSLRPDSVPASANELVRKKGLGWEDAFSVGDTNRDRGVPLVSAFRWDTGVQLHAATRDRMFSGAASITTGTLANPLFADDNNGRQYAGRVEARPIFGLVLGASAARGPFVTSAAARAAVGDGHDGEFTQTAWGADAEYSRGHYLVRFESIVSDWRLPLLRQPGSQLPVRAVSTSFEGRYKIAPGFYAAARAEHLGFSDVQTTAGVQTWEAPVTRVEVGGGFSIQRNLLLKVSYQHDTRVGGLFLKGTENATATQIVYWF